MSRPPQEIESEWPGPEATKPATPGGLGAAWIAYACAAAASLILAVLLLRLWRADLRVPFDYRGDAVFFGMIIKAVVDEGWYLTNGHLGAPGVLTLHDFPVSEAFHLGLIKAMTLFSHDWALLFNLYFLLGVPLITLAALTVFRHFRVAYAPALAGSLLYAFSATRLFKGETHYFLDIFYEIPLGVLVALWVFGESPPLVGPRSGTQSRYPRISLRGDLGRSLAALGICVVTAATGIYYAFFLGTLILAGGILAAVERRSLRHAVSGLILTGSIVAVVAIQAVPTLVYQARQGPNPQLGMRFPQQSEVYGLRIARLLLPVDGHRIPALRRLKELSDRASALPRGESTSIGLGVVGSIGFLFLLGVVFVPARKDHPRRDLLRALAVFNLVAVLLATTGGFGYLFALLVTPAIRSYSRISAIVGFFSVFAVVLLMERLAGPGRRRVAIVAVVVAAVGLFDQVTPAAVRPYDRIKTEYDGHAAFVRSIEGVVPSNAMIFNLPYLRFPEGDVPGKRMIDYDPLRLYFHSRSLRWSYPAIYNRPADAWIGSVSQRPAATLVETLSAAGFAGIVVDRNGYADKGADIEAALGTVIGFPLTTSADQSLSFFSLVGYNAVAAAGLAAAERDRRSRSALDTVFLRWLKGFFGPERAPNITFHWCSGDCDLQIENAAERDRKVTLQMTLIAPSAPTSVALEGDLFSEQVDLPRAGTKFSRTFTVSPGRHLLHFHSDGAPADPPLDSRRLSVRVDNASIEPLPD